MVVIQKKGFRLTFTNFFAFLLSVMFIITVILSSKLLTKETCKCHTLERTVELTSTKKLIKKIYQGSHRLALLIPFRDRFEELLEFVPYIYDFLNNQNITYDIFVLNQIDNFRFNRASLINVGYIETKSNYDYIAMHDVDLLPLNKNLTYSYPIQPLHLAAPNLHPRYHYNKFIGGILLINREHFGLVNGLSNKYWGWGLEDDEFYVRLKDANLNITRPINIFTGMNNTFKHIHGKHRKRDTQKCYNQREITRKRDRQTGLHDVSYKIIDQKKLTINGAPFTIINIRLNCDFNITPWCDCSKIDKNIVTKVLY